MSTQHRDNSVVVDDNNTKSGTFKHAWLRLFSSIRHDACRWTRHRCVVLRSGRALHLRQTPITTSARLPLRWMSMVICQIHARFTQKQGPWCQFGFIVIHNTRLKKNAAVQPKTLLKYKVFGSNELLHVCTNTYGPPVFVLLSSTTTELSLCWIDINTAYPRQRAT